MKINKHNYEAFFLDYHEGNLSPQEVADLLLFVENHPELKEELESFENITLENKPDISFDSKPELKKEINEQNREAYFIGAVEHSLTPVEQTLLDTFLKQHPQYAAELAMFKRAKLSPETVVFSDKESLKRTELTIDDLMISSVEGLLSENESRMLKQQVADNAAMKYRLSLFEQAKVSPDMSIVYEDKESLKRRERKVIPLFYYVSGIAAAILLMIGLFFLFNKTDNNQPEFAKHETKAPDEASPLNSNHAIEQKELPIAVNENTENKNSASNKKIVDQKEKNTDVKNIVMPDLNKEGPLPIANNNSEKNKEEPLINKQEEPIANNVQTPEKEIPSMARVSAESTVAAQEEYLSLRELAFVKIKEKTLDEETMSVQKKSGRSKRFTGWDLAQIVTKGISKVTGRDVELKPTYNDEGAVTAYALGNGIEHSMGR